MSRPSRLLIPTIKVSMYIRLRYRCFNTEVSVPCVTVNIEERNERNSNKTVKPADETEAIADVIIREKEIAAGK